ncbi:DUF2098 family protein [Methanocaldococcus infernus]
MIVRDAEGKEIKIGDYVIYINTGSKGRVVDIVEREGYDNNIWVLLDNDLLYKPSLLRVIEVKEEKEKKEEEKVEIEEEIKIDSTDLSEAGGAG